ncbi:NAD(P)H-dependent oxidoreductase [Actinokineospora sp. PR83]|uniref:NADPH-dependent FMN reductase n=1 Tax=Actinokineospora sp. PR83 TaxID=2884908 RepID=UPI001F1D0D00|nr:NAD(P)H-dependent oxidoreductase [Actinokineospora sp. PR83]MCG8914878.1 NAD(P)H-dependent oxidoreductase [Actinokineospora sp. PR83]
MTMERITLAVVIGSVREGRFGPTVANWFAERAGADDAFDVVLVDVADRGGDFATAVGRADAFAVVTPEYNHGYPGALKEAIDSVHTGWLAKPVAFVSYGGLSGGLRAVEQLRQVFAELHAVTVRETVSFHNAHTAFAGGSPVDQGAEVATKKLLTHLHWWATTLREAKRKTPYPA